MGFESILKNSGRWSRRDVRWQTVPRAKTHDHRQWTAEYVGSLAAWTTTTGDGGGLNQRHLASSSLAGHRPAREPSHELVR